MNNVVKDIGHLTDLLQPTLTYSDLPQQNQFPWSRSE
jgi:hypothetical protein